jgi:hypothetical protein
VVGLVFIPTIQHSLSCIRYLPETALRLALIVFRIKLIPRPVIIILLELISEIAIDLTYGKDSDSDYPIQTCSSCTY